MIPFMSWGWRSTEVWTSRPQCKTCAPRNEGRQRRALRRTTTATRHCGPTMASKPGSTCRTGAPHARDRCRGRRTPETIRQAMLSRTRLRGREPGTLGSEGPHSPSTGAEYPCHHWAVGFPSPTCVSATRPGWAPRVSPRGGAVTRSGDFWPSPSAPPASSGRYRAPSLGLRTAGGWRPRRRAASLYGRGSRAAHSTVARPLDPSPCPCVRPRSRPRAGVAARSPRRVAVHAQAAYVLNLIGMVRPIYRTWAPDSALFRAEVTHNPDRGR